MSLRPWLTRHWLWRRRSLRVSGLRSNVGVSDYGAATARPRVYLVTARAGGLMADSNRWLIDSFDSRKHIARDRQTKTWQNTVIFPWSVEGSFSLWECCISPIQVSRSYKITISRCQDAPYPPRIHHQRWMIGGVLTMKMTISGKDCFTKVVPNNDTDIWTPSPDVRMPSIIQGSSTRDGR